jgi:hypothetical protein
MSTPDNGWWDRHYATLGPRQRLRLWRDNLPDLPQHTMDNLMELRQKNDLNHSDLNLLNVYLAKHQTHSGLPTLSVTGATSVNPGEQVVWDLTLSAKATQVVSGTAVITGQQDGDLVTPASTPFSIPVGGDVVQVAIQVAPIVLDNDRSLSVSFTRLVGVSKPLPPARTLVIQKSVVTGKGQITLPEPLPDVVRHPTDEVTVIVKVERQNVSTRAGASTPIDISRLPPAFLKSVGAADFKAGSKYGYAPVVYHPYGTGARPADVVTTPGRVDLVVVPEFDLGANPSRDFLVKDGQVVTPPTDGWWKIPGGNLSGNDWNIGWNSTGWTPAKLKSYQDATGRRPDAFCGANHPGASIQKDWAEFDAQGNVHTTTSGFGILTGCGVKGKTWHLLNVYTWPVKMPLSELAVAGQHDAHYVQLGKTLRAEWAKSGMEDWQIALRVNKEGNQNHYIDNASQGPLYGAAIARFIKGVRQGYGMTSRGRLRFTFSPSRASIVGPLEKFCSFDDDGSCLFDAASVSCHHGPQLNNEANKPPAEQLAACVEWMRGGYKPGYSYLNSDPTLSIKVLVEKYGLAYSADEWSPNFAKANWCALAPAAIQCVHDFFVSVAPRLAWDCVFNVNMLTESNSVSPVWAATSQAYKKLWHA